MDHGVNPFTNWAHVVDCGDIQNTPMDKMLAISQLEKGMKLIGERSPKNESAADAIRLITIGGDHTISNNLLSFWFKTSAYCPQLYPFYALCTRRGVV